MPVVISTTNTTGLGLVATIDKVDTDGVDVSPALRWDPDVDDFDELSNFGSLSDAFITLNETDSTGYYEAVVQDIDGAAENLRITVYLFSTQKAIGVLYNIPLPLINPEVTIDLTVEEDRD